MKLDVPTTRALLPCYVCGDLPPDAMAAVASFLDAHPELAREAGDLRAAEDACRDLMADLAGELPALAPFAALPAAPVPARVPPLRALPALLVAAAALLAVVGMATVTDGPDLLGDLVEDHAALVSEQAPVWLAETHGPALSAALVDAGVAPAQAMAPDLSHLGLEIVGGTVVPGPTPGAVVVYDDGQRRYVCQMVPRPGPKEIPDAARTVAGRVLRGFQDGETSVVVWDIGPFVCLFSADMPLAELLDAVERRLTTPA